MAGHRDRSDLYAAALGAINHLELRSVTPQGAPLPLISTGYLSNFIQPGTIEAYDSDVVAQVTAWLDEEATKLAWLAHVAGSRQGELF